MKKELGIFEKHLQIPMRIEKKKKRRANEGTLLEQIVRMFLAEQDRDLSLYAYSKTGGRGGKGQLIKYDTADNARDAIRDDPDRFDPSRAPADVKANLDTDADGGADDDGGADADGQSSDTDKIDRAQAAVDALQAAEDEAHAEEKKRRKAKEEELNAETLESRGDLVSGQGGIKASWGEAQYCVGVDTLDLAEFRSENNDDILAEIARIGGRTGRSKFPTAEEALVLEGIGLDPVKDREKAIEYIAAREVWAGQQVDDIRTRTTFTAASGFDGNEAAAMKWARSAFDGALTTQVLLEQSRMNTDDPPGYTESIIRRLW